MGRTSAKAAAKASDMAGAEIDRLADQSAPHEERASRKQAPNRGSLDPSGAHSVPLNARVHKNLPFISEREPRGCDYLQGD